MEKDLFGSTTRILSVAELTRAIRGTLETKFGAVWVQGEVSNYKLHPSGHQYFTLKDQRAQIACVIFRNTMPRTSRPLADGAQIQVYGNVSVFEARGQYQLSVQIVQTRGAGLLQAKFEALKRKLAAEGLFEAARKRPLPKFPKRIGIVTSPSGAAIRDMLNVLSRRAPHVQVLISPVRVQGQGAAAEIAASIGELGTPNESWRPLDLIVLARGGGSMEDLWEFNEEIVARAIVAAPIPVVSAVGHEVDFTIADFVADLRAPTPSAAAELIVADAAEVGRRLQELASCLERCWRNFVAESRTRLRFLSERTLARELLARVRDAKQQVDLLREALGKEARSYVQNRRSALAEGGHRLQSHNPERELAARRSGFVDLARRLEATSGRALQPSQQRFQRASSMLRVLAPARTLRRGYSITRTLDGRVIRSIREIEGGLQVVTELGDGEFKSQVEKKDRAT